MRGEFTGFFKVVVILFAAFFLPFSGKAQQTYFELSWRSGILVLNSGDTISGPLTLAIPSDIVRVSKPDGSVRTFTAVNVKSFQVQDEIPANRFLRRKPGPVAGNREYRSLMWNHDKDYGNFKTPAFFVVLKSGKQTLLMRENKYRRLDSFSSYSNYQSARHPAETKVEKFYLLGPDGRMKYLRNPKKDLPAAFPKKEYQIFSFAKSNNLDFDDPIELSRIVDYANSLL